MKISPLCVPIDGAGSKDWPAGDRPGAAGLVPQPVADGFVARGSAAQVAARLAEYRAAGVDLPVIFPMPVGSDWGYQRTIAELTVW